MNRLSVALLATFLLQGCGVSWFISPEKEAVVDEHVFTPSINPFTLFGHTGHNIHALSTKLERRLVLVELGQAHGSKELKVCAESPPEASQDLDSQLTIEGTVEKIEIAKFLDELSTEVKRTFRRSQGLQFYRDGAF